MSPSLAYTSAPLAAGPNGAGTRTCEPTTAMARPAAHSSATRARRSSGRGDERQPVPVNVVSMREPPFGEGPARPLRRARGLPEDVVEVVGAAGRGDLVDRRGDPALEGVEPVEGGHAGRPPSRPVTGGRCVRGERRVAGPPSPGGAATSPLGARSRARPRPRAAGSRGSSAGRRAPDAPGRAGRAPARPGRGRPGRACSSPVAGSSIGQDLDLDRPPASPAGLVEAGVDEQAVEPGIEPVRITKPGQVTPGAHQGVLDRVARELGVPEDEARGRVQPGGAAVASTAKAS